MDLRCSSHFLYVTQSWSNQVRPWRGHGVNQEEVARTTPAKTDKEFN